MTTAPPVPAPPRGRKKRGTETTRDMVLSLAVCLLVVAPIWLLGEFRHSDEREIRMVPTAADLTALGQAVPGVPVPQGLPAGWRATSSTLEGERLRIGYVTPGEQYAEYAALGGDPGGFLEQQTGKGRQTGRLQVDGRAFQVWSGTDGATSLVLQQPGWTVVVGGLRETADDDELQELAASLTG